MTRLGDLHVVTQYSKLYAVQDMQAVIAAVDAENVPATAREAAHLVSLLISSYPHTRGQLTDKEWGQTLMRLQEGFEAYPAIVGWKAVDVATGLPSRHAFLPKPFDVVAMCREIKERLIGGRVMAKRHIEEHARRAAEAEARKPHTPEELERRKRQVAALLGPRAMADAGQPQEKENVE